MRLLGQEWENVKSLESLWRDLHFPPETATIMLMLKLLAMKRLDPSVAQQLETYGNKHSLIGQFDMWPERILKNTFF